VLRAALVHEHFDVRMLSNDRSGCAGVVEMNMRQQDVTNVRPPDAIRLQPEFERLETTGRTGIDYRNAAMTLDEPGCDDQRAPAKQEIDP
jgi:hypothetical protein